LKAKFVIILSCLVSTISFAEDPSQIKELKRDPLIIRLDLEVTEMEHELAILQTQIEDLKESLYKQVEEENTSDSSKKKTLTSGFEQLYFLEDQVAGLKSKIDTWLNAIFANSKMNWSD
jgi:peptidoglycan hydrolase CwlO-like protein